jgi:hypothetical protein
MIEQTIEEIEHKLADTSALNADQRAELLQLLATLKSEIGRLSKTNVDQAKSIAGFVELSAHEATRSEKNPQLLRLSLTGLGASVAGIEKSHPRLVEIVNTICTTLSNLGI